MDLDHNTKLDAKEPHAQPDKHGDASQALFDCYSEGSGGMNGGWGPKYTFFKNGEEVADLNSYLWYELDPKKRSAHVDHFPADGERYTYRDGRVENPGLFRMDGSKEIPVDPNSAEYKKAIAEHNKWTGLEFNITDSPKCK
jgi:hypothetical protein